MAAMLVLGITAGCNTTESSDGGPSPAVSASTIAVKDPWVKAADSGMTAAFAILVNDGDTDVTVMSATASVSPVELHEVTMTDGKPVMQQKSGGFTIKADSSHLLEPGGDHLMLMEISKPIKPGEEVAFTLTLDNGETVEFAALAKPFSGAGESYGPDHDEHSGH